MGAKRHRIAVAIGMLVALLPAVLTVPFGVTGGVPSAAAATPPATFRISGTSLDFGHVPVGTTGASQAVTITNVSGAPVLMEGSGGGGGVFGGSQNCQGQTLDPGASCQMFYEFSPTAPGRVTGTAGGVWSGQSYSLSFSGTGSNRFSVTPTGFDFGDVAVGTRSAEQAATVTNVSSVPALISMSGGGAGLFGGAQNCQGHTLAEGESCQIFYAFTPTATGAVSVGASGTVNGQVFSFRFTGTGVDRFLVSPKALDFGEVQTGTTGSTQAVTVTNTSGSPAVIDMSGGGGGVDFGGVQNCEGVTLAAGGSCQISYTFAPTAPGIRTATAGGILNGQAFSVKFSGIGTGGVLTAAVPTVSGAAVIRQTLTAGTAGWTAGTSFAYQWKRAGTAIPGATGKAYQLVAADVGSKITVTATGSKPGFTDASATSAATSAVLNTFTTAPAPTISGTAKVGQKLTAVTGTWAPSPAAFGYQWKRGGTAIAGATASTYTLTNADAGQTVSVGVTASRSGYQSATRSSGATALVTGGTLTAPTPTISGTTTVGQKLTAVPGTWTAGAALTYRWNRNGAAIAGATASQFTLTPADANRTITVTVTGAKPGFATVSKTSSGTAPVTGIFTTAGTPTIAGTAKAGQKLTAVTGTFSPTPTTFHYQWKRSGTSIAGATASTYTPVAADVGTKLTVTVTAVRSGYQSASKTSAATAAVVG